MSDILVYLADGTSTVGFGQQNAVTAGSLDRFLILPVGWSEINNETLGHPNVTRPGFKRTGVHTSERVLAGTIVSQWTGANPERNLLDEANDDLPDLFATERGEWTLRVDRTDSAAATTSRVLDVDTVFLGTAYEDPQRAMLLGGGSYVFSDFVLQASFPLWRDRVATAESALTVGNNDATTTDNQAWGAFINGGFESCGLKVKFSSDDAGEVTSIAIVCTEAALTATWTDAEFAVNDELDFWVDSPTAADWTTGNAITPASEIGLARGTNSGTIQGTGTNSPAFKAIFSYRRFWKGF